jgi:hypothetical protein
MVRGDWSMKAVGLPGCDEEKVMEREIGRCVAALRARRRRAAWSRGGDVRWKLAGRKGRARRRRRDLPGYHGTRLK